MTIERCAICANPLRTRAVELLAQGGMTASEISRLLEGGYSRFAIDKHLKEMKRVVMAPDKGLVRERVLALQTMQLDEFERRIGLAKERADEMNANRERLRDAKIAAGEDPTEVWAGLPDVDWSEFVDILGKDFQAAISSILKAQGLTDKRDKATADLKLGLFEAMSRAGLAPKGQPVASLPEPSE